MKKLNRGQLRGLVEQGRVLLNDQFRLSDTLYSRGPIPVRLSNTGEKSTDVCYLSDDDFRCRSGGIEIRKNGDVALLVRRLAAYNLTILPEDYNPHSLQVVQSILWFNVVHNFGLDGGVTLAKFYERFDALRWIHSEQDRLAGVST